MMKLQAELIKHIALAFEALFQAKLGDKEISVQPTKKEFSGDFTFVCFPYLKYSKKSPEETASQIGGYLLQHTEMLRSFNVVKGFLNLEISDKVWTGLIQNISENESFGFAPSNNIEVMVEYSSPNTNKPLHLGHMRNIFLGYSVSMILEAAGYKVIKTQIFNDRGIHICKSIVAWKHFGSGDTPEKSGKKGDKFVGDYYVMFEKKYREQVSDLMDQGMDKEEAEKSAPLIRDAQDLLKKWESKDPEVYELWEQMNGWVYSGFEESYRTMGVSFDKNYYESKTFELGKKEVEKGMEKRIFYQEKDGSIWVDLTEEGLDKKLLLRSDGTSVYITQDLGTAIQRFREFPGLKKLVYTVGNEQEYHFKVLFLVLKKLGYDWAEGLYHLSYGMVDLPSGKMKSREGTVVDADDLIMEMIETAEKHTKELGKVDDFNVGQARELYQIIGLGALKYFLLKVDPRKRMLFNPEESIQFHGNTGPFIQYTHARLSAILRKADEMQINYNYAKEFGKDLELDSTERSIMFLLNQFPEKIKEAVEELSPSVIANYVYDLAKEYNKFYAEIPILNAKSEIEKIFRIKLSLIVGRTIKQAMRLLGIEVPQRM